MADLGTAYVNIVPKAQGIEGQIDDLISPGAEKAGNTAGQKAGSGFGKGIGKALAGTAVAVGTAVVGAGAALVNGTNQLASYADNIDKMSQKMGISAQAYQEWDAIMQHSGTSIEGMQRGMMTLQNAAASGSEAFEAIGLSLEDVANMSTEDLFAAVITGLQGMEEGAERTALAQDLLGGAAKELGPLLNTSAEDTEAMRQRVHELGGVLSDEAVAGGAAFTDSLQDMNTAIDGVKNGIMSQFLPGMTEMMNGFTSLILGEEGATDAISQGLSGLLDSVGQIAGPFLSTFGELIPQLITVLVAHLPEIIEGGMTLLMGLIDGLIAAAPQLIEAGLQIILTLITGIANNAPQLIQSVVELIPVIVEALIAALPQLIIAGIELLIAIVNGIVQSLPTLIQTIVQMIPQIVSTLMANLPLLIQAGIQLLIAVISGILQSIPQLIAAVPQIISALISGLQSGIGGLLDVGTNIVQGIWNGISAGLGWIKARITEWVGNVVDFIKRVFKIGSPSKLMRDEVGIFLAKGIGVGFEKGMTDVNNMIKDAVHTDYGMSATVGIIKAAGTISAENSNLMQTGQISAESTSAGSSINLYIDGIKYNTDGYIDDSIRSFVETMVRKQKMYAGA